MGDERHEPQWHIGRVNHHVDLKQTNELILVSADNNISSYFYIYLITIGNATKQVRCGFTLLLPCTYFTGYQDMKWLHLDLDQRSRIIRLKWHILFTSRNIMIAYANIRIYGKASSSMNDTSTGWKRPTSFKVRNRYVYFPSGFVLSRLVYSILFCVFICIHWPGTVYKIHTVPDLSWLYAKRSSFPYHMDVTVYV